MLEGAIIGAVAGLIVSLIMIVARKGLRKEFLRLLGERPELARQYLDRKIPALRKVPLGKILDQRERMVGLALLADLPSLEQELEAHTGALTAVVQVNAIALLGIALRSPDPGEAARRLDALAAKMEAEGGATMALVKKKVRALATLALALGGQPLPSQTRLVLESFSGDGGMVQLLVWSAIARALERSGQSEQAEGLRRKVREHTGAFEAEPSGGMR
jgi:hypothetical protein